MAPNDTEMHDSTTEPAKLKGSSSSETLNGVNTTPTKPKSKTTSDLELYEQIAKKLVVLERAAADKELRLVFRVLQGLGKIRREIRGRVLKKLIEGIVKDREVKERLCRGVEAVGAGGTGDMEIVEKEEDGEGEEEFEKGVKKIEGKWMKQSDVSEVIGFLWLLVITKLVDAKEFSIGFDYSSGLIKYLGKYNSRTLDHVNARSYFYLSLCAERLGRLPFIRSRLMAAHCTAVLHIDEPSQAVLYNLIVRNYLASKLYAQAEQFVSRAQFPLTRSNNQLARHHYYMGRIKAVQLDYTEALGNLQQSLRKAPQEGGLAFRIAIQKMIIIVQLLTGEIPERGVFRKKGMKAALNPYLELTKAVRVGDLILFNEILEKDQSLFEKDGLISLIARLRHNVIKTGLRKIATAYSKISLQDIADKLGMDSSENAEGVVAKAIRDGVIDATIYSQGGYISTSGSKDIYNSMEPAESYHARVEFCLNIHNEAKKAMRFPNEKDKGERKTRERPEEIANRILVEEEEEDGDL